MNDSSLSNYQQLITSRNAEQNQKEIELVPQNQYVKQEQLEPVKNEYQFNIQETEQPPAKQEKQIIHDLKKEQKQSLTQSFYISYFILIIPVCASITGLADTEQITHGSIPKYLQTLFILLLVVSILNLIYLILTQFFVARNYETTIPLKAKLIISGIWFLWNLGITVIGGLSFRGYDYMTKDCMSYYSEIWDSKAIDVYSVASNTLCTSKCLCDMKFPFILSTDLQKKINPYINNSKMVVNISHCSGLEEKDELFYQLKQIENSWKCSGICHTESLFYFSDINRGMPDEKRPCLQVAIEDYLPSVVNLAKYSSLFACVIQYIVILYFLFSSCFNKPKSITEDFSTPDGADPQKYSSGGSGGSEIEVDGFEGKSEQDDFYNTETNQDTMTYGIGTDYYAKMFARKNTNTSKMSRQSTQLSGGKYSITSSQFMQVLRKSKLPNEQNDSPSATMKTQS